MAENVKTLFVKEIPRRLELKRSFCLAVELGELLQYIHGIDMLNHLSSEEHYMLIPEWQELVDSISHAQQYFKKNPNWFEEKLKMSLENRKESFASGSPNVSQETRMDRSKGVLQISEGCQDGDDSVLDNQSVCGSDEQLIPLEQHTRLCPCPDCAKKAKEEAEREESESEDSALLECETINLSPLPYRKYVQRESPDLCCLKQPSGSFWNPANYTSTSVTRPNDQIFINGSNFQRCSNNNSESLHSAVFHEADYSGHPRNSLLCSSSNGNHSTDHGYNPTVAIHLPENSFLPTFTYQSEADRYLPLRDVSYTPQRCSDIEMKKVQNRNDAVFV